MSTEQASLDVGDTRKPAVVRALTSRVDGVEDDLESARQTTTDVVAMVNDLQSKVRDLEERIEELEGRR